jgi:hypothetical protein
MTHAYDSPVLWRQRKEDLEFKASQATEQEPSSIKKTKHKAVKGHDIFTTLFPFFFYLFSFFRIEKQVPRIKNYLVQLLLPC